MISNNKANASSKGKEHSNKKSRGHQRAKSSLMQASQRPPTEEKTNNENLQPGVESNTAQTGSGTTQASSLKPDAEYENIMFPMEIPKETTPRHNVSQRDPNNTPMMKEERLFDQFFNKGGCVRRSMSLEDLRLEKRGGLAALAAEEKSVAYSPAGNKDNRNSFNNNIDVKSFEKSPEKSNRPNTSLTARGDFLATLNNYINYFDKSDNATHRNKNANQYFVSNDGKGSHLLRKELQFAQTEIKALKKHAEALQFKMMDLAKMNKHLVRELSDMKSLEQGYQQVRYNYNR